ncbi:PHB protein [Podarcis lilfordi]|uniref:Prohibitin n=1 Tax=Podarcis lilfordi TaxID=74358 RepID=A0AA35LML0_9SAUR|nr:PHB protein [Podarcis lilfordi]
MAAKIFETMSRLGLGLAVAGGIVNSVVYTVDAGHKAVIFDRFRGVQDVVVGEGSHFLVPWVQKPVIFDCRSRPRNIPVVTGSKDLQNVDITLRILFRPVAAQLPWIYTTVSEELAERAAPFGLVLDDVSLTHLTFGKEFVEAVEMKQVAQQEAERARFMVEKAEQLKAAAVLSAEGDAKAAQLIASSLASAGDGLIELRKLEAAEDIAFHLAPSRNVTYLPTLVQPAQQVKLASPS